MQELSLGRGHQGTLQHGGSCRGAAEEDESRGARASSSCGARWGTRNLGGTLCEPPRRKGEGLAGRNISGRHGDFCRGDAAGWPPLQQVPQGAVRAPGFSQSHVLLWSHCGHRGTLSCLKMLKSSAPCGPTQAEPQAYSCWEWSSLQHLGLMSPPCPAISSPQCHPAVWCSSWLCCQFWWWRLGVWVSCWPQLQHVVSLLHSLVIAVPCWCFSSHFLKQKILEKWRVLQTGIHETSLRDVSLAHEIWETTELRWHRPP